MSAPDDKIAIEVIPDVGTPIDGPISAETVSSAGQFWITPAKGGWEASGRFQIEGNRVICSKLSLEAATPGVTSALLRQIPMGRVEAACRRKVEEISALWATVPGDSTLATHLREIAKHMQPEPPPRGRRGYPDDHYRRIALAYLDLQHKAASSRGLLGALADAEGKPRETIRDWVHEARRRGFLTPASRGKGGAMAGPKLLESMERVRPTMPTSTRKRGGSE